MRIGDLLLKDGIVREEHLEAARRLQERYGGRFGSALVQLGYVDLDTLARALGRQRSTPALLEKHVRNLDRSTLRLLPAHAAEKWLAIPVGYTARAPRRLIVAFRDPSIEGIEEIEFSTVQHVEAAIAPEVLIFQLLDHHYGIRRSVGVPYVTSALSMITDEPLPAPMSRRAPAPAYGASYVDKHLASMAPPPLAARPTQTPPPPVVRPTQTPPPPAARPAQWPPPPAARETRAPLPKRDTEAPPSIRRPPTPPPPSIRYAEPPRSVRAAQLPPPPARAAQSTPPVRIADLPPPPPMPRPMRPPPPPLPPRLPSVLPVADPLPAPHISIAPRPSLVPTLADLAANLSPARPTLDLDEALAQIAAATSSGEIGDAIVDHLRGSYGCGVVLILRNGVARGWKGFTEVDHDARIESIAVPLDEPSVLALAYERRSTFRGRPPPEGATRDHALWQVLSRSTPLEVLVAPIVLDAHVTNLVYAHAVDGGLLPFGAAVDLTRIGEAAAEAYARLINEA